MGWWNMSDKTMAMILWVVMPILMSASYLLIFNAGDHYRRNQINTEINRLQNDLERCKS